MFVESRRYYRIFWALLHANQSMLARNEGDRIYDFAWAGRSWIARTVTIHDGDSLVEAHQTFRKAIPGAI